MKLIITRHGETVDNVNRVIQGQKPGKLSDEGKKQAKKLGQRLKNEKIDFVYSSDLKRAIDTSKKIIKHHPQLKLILDKRIRERSFGELEGKKIPENWSWETMPTYIETNESICKRVKSFIDEINKKHSDKTVVVVCHGGTKKAFLTVLNNVPCERMNKSFKHQKNTAVSIFEIEKNAKPKMITSNCTKHLE
ncbi:histidine phosphatase family protein [Candidatus Parcubacteria bacterium]|nr:MAG: histidine phosphatase family protein [Candidatus Parcubacteria bacterium]